MPLYWEYDGKSRPSNIFQSTIGFEALLKLLVNILEHDINIEGYFNQNTFEKHTKCLQYIDWDDVTKYPLATSSKKKIVLEMYILVFPDAEDIEERKIELDRL